MSTTDYEAFVLDVRLSEMDELSFRGRHCAVRDRTPGPVLTVGDMLADRVLDHLAATTIG